MSIDKFKNTAFIDINGITHFFENIKEAELSKYILNDDINFATNDDILSIFNKNYEDDEQIEDYLTFTVENDSSFSFTKGDFTSNNIEYSTDKSNWTILSNDSTPIFKSGTKVYWKGNLTTDSTSGIGNFSSTDKFNISGNPISLLKNNKLVNFVFAELFRDCEGLTDASGLKLDSTTLLEGCYSFMFYSCTSLTKAPELPATNLANSCYNSMFGNCTSLTEAPELPATNLANSCYSYMFINCTSLTEAPELPATNLANSCYSYMFMSCWKLNYIKIYATDISANNCLQTWVAGVSSTGTFYKDALTHFETGYSGIPEGWNVIDF